MIKSFADKATEAIHQGKFVKGIPANVLERALRKLQQLAAAGDLRDLAIPPGNQLEHLLGDRAGWHSIRVNQQWRLCFRWEDGHAHDVKIVDYH
ncbi:MAG: type II toxin-antitoxin system RelE/ParE family toxin [Steroidobacteraceae bacterium]